MAGKRAQIHAFVQLSAGLKWGDRYDSSAVGDRKDFTACEPAVRTPYMAPSRAPPAEQTESHNLSFDIGCQMPITKTCTRTKPATEALASGAEPLKTIRPPRECVRLLRLTKRLRLRCWDARRKGRDFTQSQSFAGNQNRTRR
jgi:hypothetical protein